MPPNQRLKLTRPSRSFWNFRLTFHVFLFVPLLVWPVSLASFR
jgi:hypothetical protein